MTKQDVLGAVLLHQFSYEARRGQIAALKKHLREQRDTRPGTAAELHGTDRAMKTQSTSPTRFSSPPGWPHPRRGSTATRRGPDMRRACHSAVPAAAALRGRTHHHLLEDALQLRLHGDHGDRHGAGPGPAGPFVRRRRRRPPPLLPPRRKLRPGSRSPGSACSARLFRAVPPAPACPRRGESSSVLKFESDLVLFFFLRKYFFRLLCFLNNLFFE